MIHPLTNRTPTWFRPFHILVAFIALALLVEFLLPNASLSVSAAHLGAFVGLIALMLWSLTFWSKARVQIGQLNLRYKTVRTNAGIAAAIGLAFIVVQKASLGMRVQTEQSRPDVAANTSANQPPASKTSQTPIVSGSSAPPNSAASTTSDSASSSTNSASTATEWAPPTYVGEVEIDHQGEDGLNVWFTLADAGSNETCADGTVTFTISELITMESVNYSVSLYSEARGIRIADFAKWNFTNKLTGNTYSKLRWDSGRISLTKFSQQPFPSDSGEMGEAEVVFQMTDGQVLRGKSDGLFNFDQSIPIQ